MVKIFFKWRCFKLIFLVFTFIMGYLLFYGRDFPQFHGFLLSLNYLGTFFAGVLFAYGFTAAPATALLLILGAEQNIFWAALVGGFGALVSDFVIFKFVRLSFGVRLSRKKAKVRTTFLRNYLVPVLAGFIIASPLPDEVGVSLLALSKDVSPRVFLVISYILNSLGIFVVLSLSKFVN